jgi:multidrug transporter EmrE-like cation transporter
VVFGEMLRVENVLGILLIFTALVVLNSRNVKR